MNLPLPNEFSYLVQLFFRVAMRSKENPATPVTNLRQCHRHHALRNPIQLEGSESLFHVITTALIGMLRNRVINPEAAKHSAVAMSHQKRVLSARPSTAAVTVIKIVAIPRIGSAGMEGPNTLLVQGNICTGIEPGWVEHEPHSKHGTDEERSEQQIGKVDDCSKHLESPFQIISIEAYSS